VSVELVGAAVDAACRVCGGAGLWLGKICRACRGFGLQGVAWIVPRRPTPTSPGLTRTTPAAYPAPEADGIDVQRTRHPNGTRRFEMTLWRGGQKTACTLSLSELRQLHAAVDVWIQLEGRGHGQ
jgi:hypothetical protein